MDFFHSFLPNIQHLGVWGYWIVFTIALLESLVLIGTVVPGSTLIVFAGFLSAHGYFELGDLIWFAAIGAILGDGLSFYLGRQSTRFFRIENRVFKLKHLEKGQAFFRQHGNKSILFGRFFGPIRSIVPFVAGFFKMKKGPYLIWNVISAILWASAYLLLGYFFGGSLKTIETWSTRFGFFLLFLSIFFLLIWILVKKGGPVFAFLKSRIVSFKESVRNRPGVQRFITNHSVFFGFLNDRTNKNRFSGLPLTLLLIAFIYILSLFLGLIQDVINSENMITVDISVANLLYAFRDKDLIRVFLWFSMLLDWKMIIVSIVVVSALCWFWQRRIYVIPFLTVMGGTELFNFLGKLSIHRLRPEVAFYTEKSFSFPSGHATMAVALFGFGTYILFRELKNWKYKINVLFFSLASILAIGLGRLYLGVHFLSDVLGGYLLGALWLIIGVSILESLQLLHVRQSSVLNTARMKIFSAGIVMAQALFYICIALNYHPPLNLFKDESPVIITREVLATFREKNLPHYTETLLGANQIPLGFMIIAQNDAQLIRAMQKTGWHLADPTDFASLARLAKSAFLYKRYPTAPMTPSFWDAQVQDLSFEKPVGTQRLRRKHRARFWRTHLQASEQGRVYVGTVARDKSIKWLTTHVMDPDLDAEREFLFEDLKNAGAILDDRKEQFVDPIKNTDVSDVRFFTDGKLYLITLKYSL